MCHIPYLTQAKNARRILPLVIATLAVMVTRTQALTPVGDNAQLFVTGTATYTYSDNVFLLGSQAGVAATGDTYWDFTPGLSLDFGQKSQLHGTFSVMEDFQVYEKHSGLLDTQLNTDSLTAVYDDGKTNLTINGSFSQLDQPDELTRELITNNPSSFVGTPGLIKRNTYTIGGNDEETVTDKSSVSAGVTYSDTQYQTPGYSDLNSTTVPVNYYYKVDPKVDVSLGAAYTTNSVGSSPANAASSSNDYFINLGMRGQFTPLLSGQFQVGWEDHDAGRLGKSTTVGISSNFTYAVSDKTTIAIGIMNGYGYNAFGSGFENTGGNITVTTALDQQWSVHANASYNYLSYLYTWENDNYYVFGVGATYAFSKEIGITANLTHTEDSSNQVTQSFSANTASISASFRY